jgi:hypothetical protein
MASGLPPAIFIADAPALDFLNSIATPADTEIDWIQDGQGFLEWLEQAQLVPPDALKALGHRRCRENSTASQLRPAHFENGSENSFPTAKVGRCAALTT